MRKNGPPTFYMPLRKMKESVLKKYFENQISVNLLADDLKNSQQKTGYFTISISIESLENGGFEIKRENLLNLCETYLNEQISNENLNTIGCALMCSDIFRFISFIVAILNIKSHQWF